MHITIKMKFLPTITLSIIALFAIQCSVYATPIPSGVTLAKVQELTRDNGAEPASLDPQKVEGLPGGHIVRDLFEGLETVLSNL